MTKAFGKVDFKRGCCMQGSEDRAEQGGIELCMFHDVVRTYRAYLDGERVIATWQLE